MLIFHGGSALWTYILMIVAFLISTVLSRPIVQDERNEVVKLGKNLILSMVAVYLVKFITGGFSFDEVLIAGMDVLLSYSFYKIFINSIGVIQNVGADVVYAIEEIVGAACMVVVATVFLSGFEVFGVTLASVVSLFLIMLLAWKEGVVVGTISGVLLGLILGLAGLIEPVEILIYFGVGVGAGAFYRFGRMGVLIGGLIAGIVTSFLINGNIGNWILYTEILLSFAGVMFVPKSMKIDIEGINPKGIYLAPIPFRRLGEAEGVDKRFSKMSKTVSSIAKSYGLDDDDLKDETDSIKRSKEFFVEDFLNSLDNFSNNLFYQEIITSGDKIIDEIYLRLVEREEITEKDIVNIFEKRKIIISLDNQTVREDVNQIVRIVNRTYRVNEMNFQWKRRIILNRKNISKQLESVSKAISDIAYEMAKTKESAYIGLENEIKELLKHKEIDVKELKIKQNKDKKYFVDILFEKSASDRDKIKCVESILTKVCKEKIVLQRDSSRLENKLFLQRYISGDKFSLQLGLARLPKTAETISGDSCIEYVLDDNKHMVSLSDGIASGQNGREISQIVVKMIRQNLAMGYDKEDSINVINKSIKEFDGLIKATIDTVVFDLYKGKADFIKVGACKTYVKNKQNIEIVESKEFVNDCLNSTSVEAVERGLNDGDIFVICSDGIINSNAEASSDRWFFKVLKGINTNNVQRMADQVLNSAIDNGYGILKDDMTVVVVKVNKI